MLLTELRALRPGEKVHDAAGDCTVIESARPIQGKLDLLVVIRRGEQERTKMKFGQGERSPTELDFGWVS